MAGRVTGAVTVRVPATSANLGPGFDAFGLALALHDEVTVEVTSGGLAVEVAGEGAGSVPRDETHLVVSSALAAFDNFAGGRPPGLAVRCVNAIPHGRGLGSSAAAIVAGVLAAHALTGRAGHGRAEGAAGDGREGAAGDGRAEAYRLAADLEGHPDNVAACVYGAFTLAWGAPGRWAAVRLDPLPDLRAVLCVPDEAVPTERARGLLPASVPHPDAAFTAARAGLLVAALTRDLTLLVPGTEDRLHQAYRAPAMPRTLALVDRLRAAGFAAAVSGAGPSVLVLLGGLLGGAGGRCEKGGGAGDLGDSITRIAGTGWHIHPLDVDRNGAGVQTPRSHNSRSSRDTPIL